MATEQQLVEEQTGSPVSDLALTHSVFMHLIATRADLATFTHVHPEPTGTAGELAVEMLRLVKKAAPCIFKYAGPSCVYGRCGEGAYSFGKAAEVRARFEAL